MAIGTNSGTSMWLERLPVPLHHPALLALAPAVGYAIAYFDRLGEALAYGIPPDYISISVTDTLSRTILVVVYTALFWSVIGKTLY